MVWQFEQEIVYLKIQIIMIIAPRRLIDYNSSALFK